MGSEAFPFPLLHNDTVEWSPYGKKQGVSPVGPGAAVPFRGQGRGPFPYDRVTVDWKPRDSWGALFGGR